MSWICFWSDH